MRVGLLVTGATYRHPSVLAAEVVTVEDRAGRLWIGTINGLNRRDPATGRITRYLHDPENASPYGPSSRRYLNPLYVDVEAVPGFADCDAARDMLADPAFRETVSREHAEMSGLFDQYLEGLRKAYSSEIVLSAGG